MEPALPNLHNKYYLSYYQQFIGGIWKWVEVNFFKGEVTE